MTALHGRTGDGSRLLQIELASEGSRPFFASASNVLLPPVEGDEAEDRTDRGEGPHASRAPGVWLGGSGSAAHLG